MTSSSEHDFILGPARGFFRLTDLHKPDVLPILGVPVIASPPRSTQDDIPCDVEGTELSATTLDQVIKLVQKADISELRLLDTPKPRPEDFTPLMSKINSRAPGLFDLKRKEIQVARERPHHASSPLSANLHVTPSSAGPTGASFSNDAGGQTPASPSPHPPSANRSSDGKKRARISGPTLKLNIASSAKSVVAPTKSEEVAAIASAVQEAMEVFSRRYHHLLGEATAAEDVNVPDNEESKEIMARHLGLADFTTEAMQVDDTTAERHGRSSPSARLLEDVRTLGDVTVRARGTASEAILPLIPRERYSQTLRVLRAAIQLGRHALLVPDDDESCDHVAYALASLEAGVVVMRLSVAAAASTDHVGHAVSEEAVEVAIDAARFQLQHNVLPFHDVRLRAATRPELGKEEVGDLQAGDANPAGTEKSEPAIRKQEAEEGTAHVGEMNAASGGRGAKGRGRGAKGRGDGRSGGKGQGRGNPYGLKIPQALGPITDRVQAVMSMLCDLLPAVKVPAPMLAPLLRSSVAVLTVPSLAGIQTKSAAVLAAGFRAHPDLRRSMLQDLMTYAVPYLGGTKVPRRDFPLGSGSWGHGVNGQGGVHVQVFTAAVLQMVQGCADLPAVPHTDVITNGAKTSKAENLSVPMSSPADVIAAYGPPVKASDYFWSLCLDRLPIARAHKAETDMDFAAVLQGIIMDLLAAAASPEWPAATTLLLRLVASLNSQKGLQHSDPVVRQVCVDILGRVLAAYHASDVAFRQEDELWLDGIATENAYEDGQHAAQELLLKYLADRHHATSPAAATARKFILVRALSEAAAAIGGPCDAANSSLIDSEARLAEATYADLERLHVAILDAWKKSQELDATIFDTGLDSGAAYRLARASSRWAFARAAPAMLAWLLELLDPRAQAPTTRAKAVKALGELAAADPSALALPAVQSAVERALGDESISVREAALGLLGLHMTGDPELALTLLDTVIKSIDDPGASVRKCAIKILRDAALTVPEFPRAIDAACALLPKVSDPEESVQNAVSKVFHALWFEGSFHSATAKQRAARFANVAVAAYEAGGPAIRLPLDSQHFLVTALRAAVGWEAKGELHVEWKAGQELAVALLEAVLSKNLAGQTHATPPTTKNAGKSIKGGRHESVEEEVAAGDVDDDDVARPLLVALHALAVTDPEFCVPTGDPRKFLRALAPYLKAGSDGEYPAELDRRRAAERLLCVLSVVEAVLSRLEGIQHTDASISMDTALSEVPSDLVALINQHRYTQVVAAACKCLAALAGRWSAAAARLIQVAQVYFSWLQNPQAHSPANSPRFLFILGQLCRHGAAILDGSTGGSGTCTVGACLAMFCRYWQYKGGTPAIAAQVQRCALEAVGQVAIARPLALVQARSEAKAMLDAALRPSAPSAFKTAALATLTEMLQCDADCLERRQRTQLATTTPAARKGRRALPSSSLAKSKKQKKTSLGSKVQKNGKRKGRGAASSDEDDAGAGFTTSGGSGSATADDDDEDVAYTDGVTESRQNIPPAVAVENGEGDTLSQSSAVLQQHWDAVLSLVTDGSGGGASAPDAVAVRRRVVALMEVVLRDGLVGPWTAVPALVALCSDAFGDVRGRALRLLCQLAEKHPQYVSPGNIASGVELAFKLHSAGSNATGVKAPPAAAAGLGAVYARVVWPSRPRRNEFLRIILRSFFSRALGRSKAAVQGEKGSSQVMLRLLGFVASSVAALPLRRAEEVCILMSEASSLCTTHTDAVLVDLNALLVDDDAEEEGKRAALGSQSASVQADTLEGPCRAASALCMLHMLQSHLEAMYGISEERAAAVAHAGNRKTAEEGTAVVPDASVDELKLEIGDVGLEAHRNLSLARALARALEAYHDPTPDRSRAVN